MAFEFYDYPSEANHKLNSKKKRKDHSTNKLTTQEQKIVNEILKDKANK